jgi:hypothetical protein
LVSFAQISVKALLMHSAKNSYDSDISRRQLLGRLGSGLVAFTVSTAWGELTPAEARAKDVPFKLLTASEGATLETLGDVLVPGAREAGVAHFVDDQLDRPGSLLFLKYMEYPSSQVDFYRAGLASLNKMSHERTGTLFVDATESERVETVKEISQRIPEGWSGPPAPLFYFVVRNDAMDVYYGTEEGFNRLQIPYMPHLPPPAKF